MTERRLPGRTCVAVALGGMLRGRACAATKPAPVILEANPRTSPACRQRSD